MSGFVFKSRPGLPFLYGSSPNYWSDFGYPRYQALYRHDGKEPVKPSLRRQIRVKNPRALNPEAGKHNEQAPAGEHPAARLQYAALDSGPRTRQVRLWALTLERAQVFGGFFTYSASARDRLDEVVAESGRLQ